MSTVTTLYSFVSPRLTQINKCEMFGLVYSQILRTFIHRQLLGIILAQLQNVDVTVAIFLKTNPQ